MGGKRKIRKKGGFPFLRILMFYNARIDTHYRACTIFNNYRGMLPIPAGGGNWNPRTCSGKDRITDSRHYANAPGQHHAGNNPPDKARNRGPGDEREMLRSVGNSMGDRTH